MIKMKNVRKQEGPRFVITQSLNYLITLLAVVLYSRLVEACPACKDSLFDAGDLPHRLATARGYALSIALLLCVPLLLIGSVSILIIRAYRRAHADERA